MAHRYYVVYQFEKEGQAGTGCLDSVVFTQDPPYAADVAAIAADIAKVFEYDNVMLISWTRLGDVVTLGESVKDTSETE